jgi:predicted RNase H-like HicB family nuclease
MRRLLIQEKVIVHPVDGMQLSQGFIRVDEETRFFGSLPGIEPQAGDTIDEVLQRLDCVAKAYYGEDVVVEISHSTC